MELDREAQSVAAEDEAVSGYLGLADVPVATSIEKRGVCPVSVAVV
jgi:hypothetical protein